MQDRVLYAADILIDRHPMTFRSFYRLASLRQGAVKRTKYRDESTKVSMVSVSRRASPPAPRAGDMVSMSGGGQAGYRAGRIRCHPAIRPVNPFSSTGNHAAFRAVNNGNGAAPVALSRNTPVTQTKIEFGGAATAPFTSSFLFKASCPLPPWRGQLRSIRQENGNLPICLRPQ